MLFLEFGSKEKVTFRYSTGSGKSRSSHTALAKERVFNMRKDIF
jgi:hypothetical protein